MNRYTVNQEVVKEYTRNSTAFLDGLEYSQNMPRRRTAAILSVVSFSTLEGKGEGGEDILAQAIAGNVIYGIGKTSNKLYKSTDGITWSRSGLYDTGIGGVLFATSTGTLLWFSIGRNLYRSTDGGQTFSQVSGWSQSSLSSIVQWGFAEANGILMVCEYGPSSALGGRYLFKSTDDGATWSIAYDLNSRTAKPYHFHTVAYHRATGKWIAAFGDTISLRNIIISSDNGQTWTDLYEQGTLQTQALRFVDDGDADSILFGDDGAYTIGRLYLDSGYIERIFNNTEKGTNATYAFAFSKINGIYYAGSTDTSGSGTEKSVIWVSSDLKNWSVYYRSNGNHIGYHHIVGIFADNIYFQSYQTMFPAHTKTDYTTLCLNEASVRNTLGLLLEPATVNLRNTVDLSSFETSASLNAASTNITISRTTEEALHGSSSIKISGIDNDSQTKAVYVPSLVLGSAAEEKNYLFTFYAKSTDNLFIFASLRNSAGGTLTPHLPAHTSLDKDWQKLTVGPITIPQGTPSTYRFYISFTQGNKAATLYIDNFQVQELPLTEWQVGGTPKAADTLTESITLPPVWTDIFFLQTTGHSYQYGKDLLLKKWSYDSSNYIELLWNNANQTFNLRRTLGGVQQTSVSTTVQFWYPNAVIKFILQVLPDSISVRFQNGREVETISDAGMDVYEEKSITITYGDFPELILDGFNHTVPLFVSEEDIELLLDGKMPSYLRTYTASNSLLGSGRLLG